MSNLEEIEYEREYPFRGKIFDIAACKVRLPDGNSAPREVMCHSGGVCVLPIDESGRAIMVRQYRFGAGEITLDAPAGKLEKGESPDTAIRRELEEETGCHAERIIRLGVCYPTPAISTERIYLYLATGLTQGKSHTDPDEFLEITRVPLKDLEQSVMAGEIPDAKTQIVILKAMGLLRDAQNGKKNDSAQ